MNRVFLLRIIPVASVAALAVTAAAPAHAGGPSGASDRVAVTSGATGSVFAMATSGASVIIGGDFATTVTPGGRERPAGSVAKFDPATGLFDPTWGAAVGGAVNAIAVSGDTVYLGGSFSTVNGQPRSSLAAVSLSSGQLLAWAPRANRTVKALAVAGGQVYVGGSFTTLADSAGSTDLTYMARISVGGAIDRVWSAAVAPGDIVEAILPTADGTELYVGGAFGRIANGSVPRVGLITTGPTPTVDRRFKAGPTNGTKNTPVYALALSGTSLLVAAGGSGGGCALLNATTGDTQWNYHTNGNVQATAFLGPYAYCGGHFGGTTAVDYKFERYKLMAVNTATGELAPFAPRLNSALGVHSLTATPTGLFAGGDFTKINQQPIQHFTEFPDLSAISAPATPAGITAHAGDAEIFLDWEIPGTDGGAGIKRYDVYRSVAGGPATKLVSPTTTSYLDETVANGTSYCYQVAAVNSVGSSALSGCSNATPVSGAASAPSVPLGLSAAPSGSSIRLSWSPPTWDGGRSLTGYTVYRGTVPGQLTTLGTVPASSNSHSDSAIQVGTRYYYAVAASNVSGLGPRTAEVGATNGSAAPGTPSLSGAAVDHTIVLQWVPSSNSGASPVTKFVIVKDGIRLTTVPAGDRSFTDPDVTAGRTYEYRIKAMNAAGGSPLSGPVNVKAQ